MGFRLVPVSMTFTYRKGTPCGFFLAGCVEADEDRPIQPVAE